jgi:flagellar basal-body rod modification protein FlgD
MSDLALDSAVNLNFKQNAAEMYKTKLESQSLNSALKKDGREPTKNLGKEEFLKLLITELEHQDPTNPMQDREFIAQMAQFSSLEQMLSLNTAVGKMSSNMTFQSSFDLLGKDVEVQNESKVDADGRLLTIKGLVESISKNGDETFVEVNGENYPISNIVKVDMK